MRALIESRPCNHQYLQPCARLIAFPKRQALFGFSRT